MTAVAPPPSFQPAPRSAWHAGNPVPATLNRMSTEDVSRIVVARKGMQRSNSSSSVASSSSSSTTKTIPAQPLVSNDGTQPAPADPNASWTGTKKAARNPWPSSKAEPVSALTTGRSRSVPAPASSAPSSIRLQPPPGHHQRPQANGVVVRDPQVNPRPEAGPALCLIPVNGTFEPKTISVPLYPDVLRIGRQTNPKTVPTPVNGYFDSKVLSRQHAEVWADRRGQIWIRDIKSSNGTFVNGRRLSGENRDSEPHELREQDLLELGIDIVSEDQKTIVHRKVAARVEHAGFDRADPRPMDLNHADLADPGPTGLLVVGPTISAQPMRVRSGSHGSTNHAGRPASTPANMVANNLTGLAQSRPPNFWLTPVTVDQVVKRLTTELRVARRQSSDLLRTGEFFDTLLSHGFVKEEEEEKKERTNPVRSPDLVLNQTTTTNESPSSRSDLKARFSDPPAPPPKQPLPEKPDDARADGIGALVLPALNWSETEMTKISTEPSSPTTAPPSSSHQMMTLFEALASARREIDVQTTRVKSLEGMLQEERMARESAEGRASRLEKSCPADEEGSVDSIFDHERPSGTEKILEGLDGFTSSGSGDDGLEEVGWENVPGSAPSAAVETKGSDGHMVPGQDGSVPPLQRRLERMMVEMTEMKQTVQAYKLRAETAEEETATTRRGLAEMVERIRRSERESSQGPSSEDPSVSWSGILTHCTHCGGKMIDHPSTTTPDGLGKGRLAPSDKATTALDHPRPRPRPRHHHHHQTESTTALTRMRTPHDHLLQSAPYASILGVVALGVGLMAYLNGWQKVDR